MDFPASVQAATLKNRWRGQAVGIYRNWLCHLAEQKALKVESQPREAEYVATEAFAALQGVPVG